MFSHWSHTLFHPKVFTCECIGLWLHSSPYGRVDQKYTATSVYKLLAFFLPIHIWLNGSCVSFESYTLPGIVPNIQIWPRWSHIGWRLIKIYVLVNAAKRTIFTFFFHLLFWQTYTKMNWDFMYLLWDQSKWSRSPCNAVKRETLMKIFNYSNILSYTIHCNNCMCEQTERDCIAILLVSLSLREMVLNTSAALHTVSLLLILMISTQQLRSIITLPSLTPIILYERKIRPLLFYIPSITIAWTWSITVELRKHM